MRRCKWISLIGAVLLCGILSGCQKEEKEPVTITVIHAWGSTEADHVAMRNIYESFQNENPDIRIQLISMPTRDEMMRKVEDMIMVGNMPDIVTFSGMGRNKTYDFMVENNMALDLMPYLKEDAEFAASVSDVNKEYWTTEENQLFTVADVLLLSGGYWYNEDIFRQAGIEEIPKTWDEFMEMCEMLSIWSRETNAGIKPHQTSAEGYLYFMDHMLADSNGHPQEVIRNHKLTVKKEDWEKAIRQLKNIYSYSAAENENYSYLDETKLFNEGKLAIYVNGVWGAPMISENINARYALLPTESSISMSCKSACLGYVLGNSGNEEKKEASVRFLKYMLSEKVQTRILEETGQIPANARIALDDFEKKKPRLYQAATLVLSADNKIDVPDSMWSDFQKTKFTENILKVLVGEMPEQDLKEVLK